MAKQLLRSGSLDDFLALGENGQPVYASALQLRETLRLRHQQSIADMLAIPQPNEGGDRIDWYAPISGKITSWIAASDEERASALSQLEHCQQTVNELSQKAQLSEKSALRLFGILLAKAMQFPGANHVFLVDGKPVLTFWGFVNLDKKSRADAFDCLRVAQSDAAPSEIRITETPKPPAIPTLKPIEQAPQSADTAATEPSKVVRRRDWRQLWWLPLALAVLGILFYQIRAKSDAPKPVVKSSETVKKTAPESEKRALPSRAAAPKTHLPVAQIAAPTPVVEVVKTPEVKPVEVQKTAVSADALVMPAEAVKLGSTRFMNGKWRASLDIKTPRIGKPPSLVYQIKNSKGSVKIIHGDGISCNASVTVGLMSSGSLVVDSRTKAKCSDGSRYKIPQLICKSGENGVADCNGRYDADTILPINMTRISKSSQ
ncbi:SrfA [Obesumbacterium proteus]|uniref:SrfA family protein n=1 Tax=Obesumbacterium proteus TaxID=82983 RepID=UPI000621A0DC|nr:SrfA family protein [Obesumbacterium proteus]KKI41812.1 SrfA [Obesumbacterium proteus]